MPSSLHARITRRAISPRLATKTFLNTGVLRLLAAGTDLGGGFGVNQEQRLAILDGLRALRQNFYDAPVDFRLNLVHELHGFHDTQDLSFFDQVTFLHIRVGVWRRRPIEGADDG